MPCNIFTQEWDEFCVVLRDIIVPLFEDVKLDKNRRASVDAEALI